MRNFIRFCLYVLFIGVISLSVYDSYNMYLRYNSTRELETERLNTYNDVLKERDEIKPAFCSNSDIASAIIRAEACHLQNCFLHLEGIPEAMSVTDINEITQYDNIEFIEYVIILDSDKGIESLQQLKIPVNDVVVADDLVILSVPSLEI